MATATFGVTSPAVTDPAMDERPYDAPRARVGHAADVGRAVLWIPAALMLALGLVGLDRHSLWRDEAASLVAARRTLPELFSMLGHMETVHAVYYTFLHLWLQLGSGEVWMRLPSVLAMAAAAGLVGVIGARLVSVPLGLVAGLLFALNPSVSYYAQEARSTAIVALVALLATWFLLRTRPGRPAWWVAYAGACAVLVGLNLLAFLVVLAHAVFLLVRGRRRRTLLPWALSAAPAVLVCVVVAGAATHQPYQIGWIPRPGLSSVRDFVLLGFGSNLPLAVAVAALVLVAVLPGRVEAHRRLRALALPMAALPPAALLAMSLVQPIFVARYVFPSVPALSLLAALGVVRVARFAARRTDPRAFVPVVAVLVLAVAVGGVGAQRLNRTEASRSDDLAGAAAVVAAGARPGDAMLFLPSNRRLVALAYPDAFAGLRDVGLGDGPVPAGNLTGRPLPLPVTLQNLSTSDRVWAIGRPGLALLASEGDARAELALLNRDFVAVQRSGAHGVGITLYVRRPATS